MKRGVEKSIVVRSTLLIVAIGGVLWAVQRRERASVLTELVAPQKSEQVSDALRSDHAVKNARQSNETRDSEKLFYLEQEKDELFREYKKEREKFLATTDDPEVLYKQYVRIPEVKKIQKENLSDHQRFLALCAQLGEDGQNLREVFIAAARIVKAAERIKKSRERLGDGSSVNVQQGASIPAPLRWDAMRDSMISSWPTEMRSAEALSAQDYGELAEVASSYSFRKAKEYDVSEQLAEAELTYLAAKNEEQMLNSSFVMNLPPEVVQKLRRAQVVSGIAEGELNRGGR